MAANIQVIADETEEFVVVNQNYRFRLSAGQRKRVRGQNFDEEAGIVYEVLVQENTAIRIYAQANECYNCIGYHTPKNCDMIHSAMVRVIRQDNLEVCNLNLGRGILINIIVPPARVFTLRKVNLNAPVPVPQNYAELDVDTGLHYRVVLQNNTQHTIRGGQIPQNVTIISPAKVEVFAFDPETEQPPPPIPHNVHLPKRYWFSVQRGHIYNCRLNDGQQLRVHRRAQLQETNVMLANLEVNNRYIISVSPEDAVIFRAISGREIESDDDQFATLSVVCTPTGQHYRTIVNNDESVTLILINNQRICVTKGEQENNEPQTIDVIPGHERDIVLQQNTPTWFNMNVMAINRVIRYPAFVNIMKGESDQREENAPNNKAEP